MNTAIIRSVLFWIVFDALLFGLATLAALIPPQWSRLVQALLGTLAAFFLIWLFLKSEKRTFADIGLVPDKGTLPKFLLGVLIGTVLLAVVLFVLVSLAGLELTRSTNAVNIQAWLFSLLVIIPFAFMEELVFRSYAFLKLKNAYGIFWAQLIAAIAFALYHIVGGWSWQVAFLGPFVWAFVFGLAAILSRGIALPTGIHVALNFLQPLTGLKPGKISFWTLQLKQGHAGGAAANSVGIGLQVAILIAAIAATYVIVKKKKRLLTSS